MGYLPGVTESLRKAGVVQFVADDVGELVLPWAAIAAISGLLVFVTARLIRVLRPIVEQ
jgi:hypothetical protein